VGCSRAPLPPREEVSRGCGRAHTPCLRHARYGRVGAQLPARHRLQRRPHVRDDRNKKCFGCQKDAALSSSSAFRRCLASCPPPPPLHCLRTLTPPSPRRAHRLRHLTVAPRRHRLRTMPHCGGCGIIIHGSYLGITRCDWDPKNMSKGPLR
jgi:hypothetical protein